MNIDYERLTRILIRISGLMLILSTIPSMLTMLISVLALDSNMVGQVWAYSTGSIISITFGILLLAKSRQIATALSK